MNYPPQAPQPVAVKPQKTPYQIAAARALRERRVARPPLELTTAKPLDTPAVQEVQGGGKSWLKQQFDDAASIVTGLPVMLWNTVKQYGELDYGAVLDGLVNDPQVVGSAIKRA